MEKIVSIPVPPVSFAAASVERLPQQGNNLQALSQRFDQLLSQASPTPETASAAQSFSRIDGTPLAGFDKAYSSLVNTDIMQPGMDMQSTAAMFIDVTRKTAMMSAVVALADAGVQSTKSSLNTLLKSQ
jgi:hypothetical protein